MFRTLKAEEVEARIGTVGKNNSGCSLLLYKDARVDMNLLDETFGVFGWQRKHETIDGNLYCTVSIYDKDTKQWIEKQDVGTESKTEATKGEASDSFKRACFNIGIGRELYTAPFIWVSASDACMKDGKTYCKFKVTRIGYDENRCINDLQIINEKTGAVVYEMYKQPKDEKITAPMIEVLKKIYKGEDMEKLLEANKIDKLEDMPMSSGLKIMKQLQELANKKNNG